MKNCPYALPKKVSCMGAECELWDVYPIEDTSKGTGQKVIREHGMCTHKWATKIAFDTAGFQDYVGKSVDKLRSVVKDGPPIKRIGYGDKS